MVTVVEHYTRSLRRRLAAVLIDVVLMAGVCLALTYPIANSLDSPVQSGLGIFNLTSCGGGTVFNSNGQPLSTEGWQTVTICDQKVDFFFPYRTAIFFRKTPSATPGLSYTEQMTFPLDGQNRVFLPVSLTYWIWLLFVAAVIAFEHLWGKTPGKALLGLRVEAEQGALPTLKQSIVRNVTKYLIVVLSSLLFIAIQFTVMDQMFKGAITADNKVVMPSVVYGLIKWTTPLSILLSIVSLVLILSICIPWGRAGRALYDRFAGTFVRSAEA